MKPCSFWMLMLAWLAGPALAQSNLFLGWHLQAGTGYQTVKPDLHSYSNSTTTTSDTAKGIPLWAGGGYTWAMTERQTLGLSYERNVRTVGAATQVSTSGTGRMGYENQYQLSVVYGHLSGNDAMWYGKLGYAGMRTTEAENNVDATGYGVGLGYKRFLNPFQYIFTEYQMTQFPDKTITGNTTFKANFKGQGLVIGAGWQF